MIPMQRRRFIQYSSSLAAGYAAGQLFTPAKAQAQTLTRVRFTLPWVAEGSALPWFVSRNKGFWRKRGLDVEISRGYGSLAATAAVASDTFDIGAALTSVVMLQVAKGLPLRSVAGATYRNNMGVAVLADSPIKTPTDLEGKTVGITPTSGEVPFIPVFATNAGVDFSKIKFVNMSLDARYRAFMDKQIDAMTDTASSAAPVLMSQGFPVRFMLFANYGMDTYSSCIFTTRKMIAEKEDVCQAFVDGAMEGVAFMLLNPVEAVDVFMKEVPEAGMSASGRESVRIGMGIFIAGLIVEEVRQNGLGWCDPRKMAQMNDLVATHVAKSPVKPEVDELFTNRFAGRIRLTEPEWLRAKQNGEEFLRIFS